MSLFVYLVIFDSALYNRILEKKKKIGCIPVSWAVTNVCLLFFNVLLIWYFLLWFLPRPFDSSCYFVRFRSVFILLQRNGWRLTCFIQAFAIYCLFLRILWSFPVLGNLGDLCSPFVYFSFWFYWCYPCSGVLGLLSFFYFELPILALLLLCMSPGFTFCCDVYVIFS